MEGLRSLAGASMPVACPISSKREAFRGPRDKALASNEPFGKGSVVRVSAEAFSPLQVLDASVGLGHVRQLKLEL